MWGKLYSVLDRRRNAHCKFSSSNGGGGRGVGMGWERGGDGVGSVSIELQSLPLLSNTTRPFNTQALSLFTKQDLFTGQMSV